MSLQDDIFDVAAALKRRPEAKAFKRLMTHLHTLEAREEIATMYLERIRAGYKALREVVNDHDI